MLLILGVGAHIVEHDFVWVLSELDNEGSDVGVPIHVWVDPGE